ncbi:MAG: TetR/AcrR family transcriptional regulator [Coriobacteriia bacterium]|nr:TetR/AcrR family transcriptional regulator [Coriobacteriia bacterium]
MAPRKANQPTLTRADIVAAALTLVDRDGLSKLSMRRLAAELSMSPMSLYYHVPDKSALYDLILDAVMSEVDLSDDDPTHLVEERLIGIAYALRRALLAHPNAVQLALSRSLRTPDQLRPVEALLGVLFEAGLDASNAMGVVNIVGQYVFGTAAAYANQTADNEMQMPSDEDFSAITADRFPMVIRAMTEAAPGGFDKDFERGLTALVRGLLG